jgi:chemotaxis protein MotB
MMQKTNIALALLCSVFLFACGTGKKLKASMAENDQLKSQNATLANKIVALQTNNDGLQKQVTDLSSSNQQMTQEYNRFKTQCQNDQVRLRLVQAALVDQYNQLQRVRERIATALANFQDKGVDVYYKNGLVYVTMSEGLLYKSGSSTLGESGKKALSSLAAALNEYPDLKVIVLGHTDNVQFKKGSDNWSLSTERANGVVRILRDDYQVNPDRLTAAGKGKYSPVGDNSTAEGRAINRRTDIIINPDLDKLWDNAAQK